MTASPKLLSFLLVSALLSNLLIHTTRALPEIIGPLLRALGDCHRIVFQADALRGRTLQFLKGADLLLLALEPHANVVGPIVPAPLLDQ